MPGIMISARNTGLFKTDPDSYLMERMSFSRHVSSPQEMTSDPSAVLDGAPTDPPSTLVHKSLIG